MFANARPASTTAAVSIGASKSRGSAHVALQQRPGRCARGTRADAGRRTSSAAGSRRDRGRRGAGARRARPRAARSRRRGRAPARASAPRRACESPPASARRRASVRDGRAPAQALRLARAHQLDGAPEVAAIAEVGHRVGDAGTSNHPPARAAVAAVARLTVTGDARSASKNRLSASPLGRAASRHWLLAPGVPFAGLAAAAAAAWASPRRLRRRPGVAARGSAPSSSQAASWAALFVPGSALRGRVCAPRSSLGAAARPLTGGTLALAARALLGAAVATLALRATRLAWRRLIGRCAPRRHVPARALGHRAAARSRAHPRAPSPASR